jgi:hypothetical protein
MKAITTATQLDFPNAKQEIRGMYYLLGQLGQMFRSKKFAEAGNQSHDVFQLGRHWGDE